MKRLWLVVGLLVLTAGMSSVFAAPKLWDKNVPIEETAIIHMSKEYTLWSVDGKALGGKEVKAGGFGLAMGTSGKGSDGFTRGGKISKEVVRIPAGKREISGNTGGGTGSNTLTFDFEAGKRYQMVAAIDPNEVGKALGGALLGGTLPIWFIDVTEYFDAKKNVPKDVRDKIVVDYGNRKYK